MREAIREDRFLAFRRIFYQQQQAEPSAAHYYVESEENP
jgi:queuine/archaeosine tRNA-ribosyltransferase